MSLLLSLEVKYGLEMYMGDKVIQGWLVWGVSLG